jgi:hypothetical protein
LATATVYLSSIQTTIARRSLSWARIEEDVEEADDA